MLHHAHGQERGRDKEQRIREKRAVAHMVHQPAGDDGGHGLGRHAERVVGAGEFSDIASLTHLYDHGQRVHVDRCPAYTDHDEDDIEDRAELI